MSQTPEPIEQQQERRCLFVSSSSGYKKAVKRISKEEGELLIAVAFWGRGAEKIVQQHNGRVKIICNLQSGATNPDTVEKLRNGKNICLKQHDRLHAKVVVGKKRAIVGSANLSANGLNLEGKEETDGWEEAGFLIEDSTEIKKIQKWFKSMWNDKETRKVSDKDIENAKAKWKKRRNSRITRNTSSSHEFVFGKLTHLELMDRRIFVVIYRKYWSNRSYKHITEEIGVSAYEHWPELPTDAPLIDVYFGLSNKKLCCHGVWTRTPERDQVTCIDDSEVLLTVCQEEGQLMDRTFGEAESKQFAEWLKPCIDDVWKSPSACGDRYGKYISLADVLEIRSQLHAPPDG